MLGCGSFLSTLFFASPQQLQKKFQALPFYPAFKSPSSAPEMAAIPTALPLCPLGPIAICPRAAQRPFAMVTPSRPLQPPPPSPLINEPLTRDTHPGNCEEIAYAPPLSPSLHLYPPRARAASREYDLTSVCCCAEFVWLGTLALSQCYPYF